MHSKAEVAQMEPLLRTDILLGGELHWEYQTDDARLTVEVLKTAIHYGAFAFNYAEVTSFLYDEQGKVAGVRWLDRLTHEYHEVMSKMVVNAAGPWVDEVRRKDHTVKGKHLRLTKGTHCGAARAVSHQRGLVF